MFNLRAWFLNLVVLACVYAGVTALFSFLLVLGLCCEVRCLMVPFLILTVVDIILAGAVGIVVVVALFYLSLIPGVVSAVVYVMVAVVSLLLGSGPGCLQAAGQGVFLHVQPSGT